MGMYGADVAQLRALAVQFERTAERLDANRLAIGNAIQIKAWIGPSAANFRLRWESEYSVKVASAARILRDNARIIRANADDQERTSATDGSGGPFFSGKGPWRTLPAPLFPLDPDRWRTLPGPLHPSGRWETLPYPVLPAIPGFREPGWDGDFGRFFGRFADSLEDTGWTFRDLGGLVPKLGGILDAADGIQATLDGKVPWHEVADLVAGGFKDSASGVGYGIGANIALWSDVVELATNGDIDWSPKGMQDAFNGLFSADAWKEVGHDLMTKLPPILAGDLAWW